MNVFDLDRALVRDYEHFARSFTQIRAPDIRQQVESIYASDRFWPEPLISINPRFERGPTVDRLVGASSLHPSTPSVFSIDDKPLQLYRHQAQAIAKAATGQSFVVTTGTGSGKSLCFFIPIIDAAIRARANGEPGRTRAVVIYPTNVNSGLKLAENQRLEIAARPHLAIDLLVANLSGTPCPVKAAAAEGGGQRPAFTGHGVPPKLATGIDA